MKPVFLIKLILLFRGISYFSNSLLVLGVQNLIATLADSVPVAIDYGMLRFQFMYKRNFLFLSLSPCFRGAKLNSDVG